MNLLTLWQWYLLGSLDWLIRISEFIFLFLLHIVLIESEMSFLEKFKGKTTVLKKDQVSEILGQKSSGASVKHSQNQHHLLKLTQIPQQNHPSLPPPINHIKKKTPNPVSQNLKTSQVNSKAKKDQSPTQPKKIIENPFLVQNQFFLDEQQRQAVLKKRKQDEIKQRIEKQRKKRQQLQQKMMKSMKASPKKTQKFAKKQWVKLGGLGANIGGQEWTKKKNLQQKMLKFAEQIKKINFQKFDATMSQSLDLRPNKSLTQKPILKQLDGRTLGIKYSKSIQKPTFYTLEKTRYENSEMKTYNSDFQAQAPRFSIHPSVQMEDGPVDPEDNEFSSLKFERNYSELQKLDERHKELKGLVYGNQK